MKLYKTYDLCSFNSTGLKLDALADHNVRSLDLRTQYKLTPNNCHTEYKMFQVGTCHLSLQNTIEAHVSTKQQSDKTVAAVANYYYYNSFIGPSSRVNMCLYFFICKPLPFKNKNLMRESFVFLILLLV